MATRAENAVAYELAKYARIEANTDAAVEDGRISAHDGEERKARAEQAMRNRVAYLRGERRPVQRTRQLLDDPDAGKV
jgi:hypothetical protein